MGVTMTVASFKLIVSCSVKETIGVTLATVKETVAIFKFIISCLDFQLAMLSLTIANFILSFSNAGLGGQTIAMAVILTAARLNMVVSISDQHGYSILVADYLSAAVGGFQWWLPSKDLYSHCTRNCCSVYSGKRIPFTKLS